MLSCGCRRLKRSTSQRVTMLPARFLKPWEVLEMDIHDMGARSEAGNKHLLVVVDRASKFLFACPLSNETAKNAVKKLLARSSPRRCPTPLQMAQRDDRYSPTDHPRAQRGGERLGGWIHETLMELWPPLSAYYSTETAVPRWMLPHQAPATRARTDCVTASPRVKTSVKCRSLQGHTAPS